MGEVYLDSLAKMGEDEMHQAHNQSGIMGMRDRESNLDLKMNDGKGLLDDNLYHSLSYSHIRGNHYFKLLLLEICKSIHRKIEVCILSNSFIE